MRRNAGIIHYALFWNGNNGLQWEYFFNNGLKTLLWRDAFWISYIRLYRFYNNSSSVVLRSKQGVTLKLVNSKHEDWASVQLLTLSLHFLDYFAEMSSYSTMKTNKQKARICLKCVKEFSRRFNSANGKEISRKRKHSLKDCIE